MNVCSLFLCSYYTRSDCSLMATLIFALGSVRFGLVWFGKLNLLLTLIFQHYLLTNWFYGLLFMMMIYYWSEHIMKCTHIVLLRRLLCTCHLINYLFFVWCCIILFSSPGILVVVRTHIELDEYEWTMKCWTHLLSIMSSIYWPFLSLIHIKCINTNTLVIHNK